MSRLIAPANNGVRIIRYPEVKQLVGFCNVHLRRLEMADQFPRRVKMGANSVGWVEAEVHEWLSTKIAQRDISKNIGHSEAAA